MDTKDMLGDESTPSIPPTQDEKTMGILAHILAVVAGFIAPLVIYLIKKDESAYVREHAKESLNFQITLLLLYIGCWILALILIGFLLMGILAIAALILIIVATIKASEGKMYKYPINFRFIK